MPGPIVTALLTNLVYPAALTAFGLGGNAILIARQLDETKAELKADAKCVKDELKADVKDVKDEVQGLSVRLIKIEMKLKTKD